MGAFRFQKRERLTRKRAIESLFQKGSSFSAFPLKVLYSPQNSVDNATQVLISVPARSFKKATDRNTLKRRIREGYRLNKALLSASSAYALAYIYIAREILPSDIIHKAIQTSLRRLNKYEKEA